MEKFYITTAIDYVNAPPHIGHVFEKILADVIARYHRTIGDDIFFLTGSDEHGLKIQQAAESKKMTPQELADKNVKEFIAMKDKFNLSWNSFIRTTDENHIKASQELWKRCKIKGDIYLKKYKGLYCTGCESFIKESDLVNGKCPNHDEVPDVVEEENWFFKLSNYKKQIKEMIEKDELKIYPEHRKKEILNVLNDIEDFSISRPKSKLEWGIEVPDDPTQNIYVWFDALTNYITGVGFPDDKKTFEKYWPADLHVIGKDITRFHAIHWPAMLLSAGLELPKAILVHGFITSGGKKMSKTLGNTIDIDEALSRYGADALRYFLLREIPTTDDGDFTWERFDIRYNELANKLGNLVSRVTNLAEEDEVSFGKPDAINFEIPSQNLRWPKSFYNYICEYKLNSALDFLWDLIDYCNIMVDAQKVWKVEDKRERVAIINIYLSYIKSIGEALVPFMPETSEKILNIFKQEKIKKAEPLFPKIK